MTYIENISIEGFKGIDQLNYSPKTLNLVTGRNNAGKTSLLEAIDLLFDPSKIQEYGEDAQYLINSRENSCNLRCEYSVVEQTSLGQFEDGYVQNSHEHSLSLRTPDQEEATEIFVSAALDLTELGRNTQFFTNRFAGETLTDEDQSREIGSLISNTVREEIQNPNQEVVSKAKDHSVIIDYDGFEYGYIYLGDFYSQYSDSVARAATEGLTNKLYQSNVLSANSFEEGDVYRSVKDYLVPRFGRGRFVNGKPPSPEGIEFIRGSLALSPEDIDLSKEDAAVRINNIEQYLIDHNVVDNLVDLSLNQLVFESEGDKYQVPYKFMGSGFKVLIGLLWILSKGNPEGRGDAVLIEEGENHLHPGYIEEFAHQLLQILIERETQVFLTTHSLDLIRSFFSSTISEDESEFLENGFQLLQMNPPLTRTYNYSESENQLNELEIDLRGL